MKTDIEPTEILNVELESCWIATLETANAMLNDRGIDAETVEVLMLWMVDRSIKGVKAKDYLFDNNGRMKDTNP